jgi:hypothetical protein
VTNTPEILDEVILFRNGPFFHIRRYLKGFHPELGYLHFGLTGPETVMEITVIRPKYIFSVLNSEGEG